MPVPNIIAVAIGDPSNSRIITNMSQTMGVRPYILGLISYLSQQQVPNTTRNYKIGTDDTIDYRECYENSEDFTGAAPEDHSAKPEPIHVNWHCKMGGQSSHCYNPQSGQQQS